MRMARRLAEASMRAGCALDIEQQRGIMAAITGLARRIHDGGGFGVAEVA